MSHWHRKFWEAPTRVATTSSAPMSCSPWQAPCRREWHHPINRQSWGRLLPLSITSSSSSVKVRDLMAYGIGSADLFLCILTILSGIVAVVTNFIFIKNGKFPNPSFCNYFLSFYICLKGMILILFNGFWCWFMIWVPKNFINFFQSFWLLFM